MEYAKVQRVQVGSSRLIATSDIHGNLDLFDQLLEKCEYRPGEDVLVIIGDMIHRGPDSPGVLRRVMELSARGRVYPLLGNNDNFSLGDPEEEWESLCWWKERAPQWQMAQRAGVPLPGCAQEMPAFCHKLEELYPKELAFLKGLPHILETDRFLFAHAGLRDEDLEHQELSFVLTTRYFPQETHHVFSKLLLVGHYSTSSYRDCLDNSPLYHEAQNVLSIDGGNTLKCTGQLNGVILNSETGGWEAIAVYDGEEIAAPCSQEYIPGKDIVWPGNQVTVLREEPEFVKVRLEDRGDVVEAPKDQLYRQNGALYCSDIPTRCLEVHKGEIIKLVKKYEDRLLIRKGDDSGWLFLR